MTRRSAAPVTNSRREGWLTSMRGSYRDSV
jgi:hypothetical protein